MQLEKAKETKQDMERCRLLAQRIAEELAPATAAVLNAETPALEKALHRAGVDANPFTVAARQADLLVVEDPAWVEMPAQLPGQVLLVFTGSNVAEGWAEELARRGYYRDFRWRSRGRAQQSALYCTVQPATAEMIAGYEKELDLLRDRMVRAERTCNEEAASLSGSAAIFPEPQPCQEPEKTLNEVTSSTFWKLTWPMRYVVSKSRQIGTPSRFSSCWVSCAGTASRECGSTPAPGGNMPPSSREPPAGRPLCPGGAAGQAGKRSACRAQDQHRGAPVQHPAGFPGRDAGFRGEPDLQELGAMLRGCR